MATTDLKLDGPGTLPRPGPIGRIARLAFGVLCLWYITNLIQAGDHLLSNDGHIKQVIWNGVFFGFFWSATSSISGFQSYGKNGLL
jgi:hypothetical protein